MYFLSEFRDLNEINRCKDGNIMARSDYSLSIQLDTDHILIRGVKELQNLNVCFSDPLTRKHPDMLCCVILCGNKKHFFLVIKCEKTRLYQLVVKSVNPPKLVWLRSLPFVWSRVCVASPTVN